MEQYNIIGDCSLLLTRGVPCVPAISHNQLPNTESLAGPYAVNCVITPVSQPINPVKNKIVLDKINFI